MKSLRRLGGMIAVVALAVSACSSPGSPTAVADDSANAPGTTAVAATTERSDTTTSAPTTTVETGPTKDPPSADCPTPPEGVPWSDEVVAEAVTLQEQGPDRPGVTAVVYPHPDYAGKPWSQWGQGIVLADGRVLSAIGDHHGVDGNSFLYVYDPAAGTLTQIADALSLIGHTPGEFGYGKIHAPMVLGPCGEVYTSTYWGTRRGLTFTDEYRGDVLLRIDPAAETVAAGDVILPEHGIASMAAWPQGGLLYAEAADPFGSKVGSFVVLDAQTGDLVFEDDDDTHSGYRTIGVAPDGSAFISWDETTLARYDPAANTLTPLSSPVPGGILRATTRPDATGTIYAVSRSNPTFFTIDPEGGTAELGPARGYTTSMALAPDDSRFYYVPDAHGGSWQQGTPVIAVDTATGAEEVIVELNDLAEQSLGLRLGGTYNVTVDPAGQRLYIGLNAGEPTDRDTFGEVVLVTVTLP